VLSIRGRDVLAVYGGEDARQVGTAFVDQGLPVARPDFQLGPRTPDRNRLWLAGIAYRGEWANSGGLSLGVQKADYRGLTEQPGQPVARRADQPWRYYGAATLSLTSAAVLYAGYTQGIEDSGAAPSNATNRGQTLPATRTWQRDAGIRYALTPRTKLVVGVFDVHKPYFNLDPAGAFVSLGDQDHRGVEFSIAGEFAKDLNIVAGVELLNPKVVARTAALGAVGDRAVGQGDHFAQLSVDYKLQSHPAWSFDLTANSYGRRAANLANTVFIPSSQTVDLGSRYQFALGGANASLRLFVLNVGNTYRWILTDSAELSRAPARGIGAYLTVDF
jgi:iron complex outermembrane receptor protein